ncbi:MAG: 16S rRNA (uracil(1498)-N(3))-methyltransferase [Ruminococcaceae bacterium]|nr:16S rRNA (uracil(1498)-N(3))-methyltransferase [Oscillospiraceae bacterium]
MPRFFVTASDIESRGEAKFIHITGDDASHISRVLRMKIGEHITACDMRGCEYETVIIRTGNEVILQVLSEKESDNEPPYKAVVYQALVKGDRFDTVLQKSTELGVSEIVPMITSRCTVKLTESEYVKKVERWQKIVREAAKQCGRAIIPTVKYPMKFSDSLKEASLADLPLFCYEGEGTLPLSTIANDVSSPQSVSVMIGPEGGYSVDEAEEAKEAGMKMTGLGRRILRTETASLFVLSFISCKYEL